MKALIDTQVWLWMQAEPERMTAAVQAFLIDSDNELFLSAASAWEIAIKYALGKLPLPLPPAEYVPDESRPTRSTSCRSSSGMRCWSRRSPITTETRSIAS